MGFKVDGIEQTLRNMDALIALVEDPATLKELFLPEGNQIRDEAKSLVRVKTGNLRDNIFSTAGELDLPNIIVGVDGSKVPYAHIEELRHPYLRPAADRAEGQLLERVAERLQRKIEGVLD